MKKTKIICTMGPNTDDRELMKALAANGMDVARFNFSHGDHEEQKARLDILKSVREELNLPIAALLDTKGPEIRTGLLKDDKKVTLKEGSVYTLTTREIIGDVTIGHINYAGLVRDVSPGSRILIDDGLIELEVAEAGGTEIVCRVINGGELGMRKGVNVPNVKIRLPALTDKDKSDILFGIEQGFDFIAASFVRSAEAVREIKNLLAANNGSEIAVIAKIENAEGIENIDEIIACSDGIMVARGDMGVEIPPEQVPYIQKLIIRKCSEACKPVITATQMLDSMIRNPRPTRAEVTDVANAVYDGTDAVMLSGETAMGKYPLEALRMMRQIVERTEEHLDYESYRVRRPKRHAKNVANAVCYSSVATASDLEAKVIAAPSISGFTTRMLSKWRPKAPIIGLSPSIGAVRKMQLYWGVTPYLFKRAATTDELINACAQFLKQKQAAETGDLAVITAGLVDPSKKHDPLGITNMMRVVCIEE